MNHGLKINGNILEITLPEEVHIDKVIVNRQIFSQRMQVCKSCKYHEKEGHEEPCVSCEVGNSNYVPSVEQEERTEKRTETHACDCISRQDAINAFEPDHPVDWYTTMIVDVLENLPTVLPQNKGKWIGKEQFANSPEFYSWKCSACGCVLEDPTMDKPYPFCPHCGSQNAEEEGEQSGID